MTLAELDELLTVYERNLSDAQRKLLRSQLASVKAVYPFNEWEYRFTFLLGHDSISFVQYEEIRSKYLAGNEFLYLFGLAPRIFGQTWGQEHISAIDDRFQVASKKLDKSFVGEYDLFLDGIKVEVKAARAISSNRPGDLVARALKYESDESYWMNFQQLKPDLCDVFVFIGVWVDRLIYWVLSSAEAKANPYISPQHRGGIEYQIGIRDTNLEAFAQYAVDRSELAEAVLRKGSR